MTTGPHDNEPLPSAPPVRPTSLPGPARPKTILYSFGLWMLVSALNVLNLAGAFQLDSDALRRQVGESSPDATPEMIDQAVTVTVVTAYVIPIVFLAAFLVGGFQILQGRNWARVLLTVFGGLLIVLSLLTAAGASPVIGMVVILIISGAIVLMYTADSKAFFEASRRSR
jgi:hypothetical protein